MVKQMEEPWRETAIDLVMLVGDGRIHQERQLQGKRGSCCIKPRVWTKQSDLFISEGSAQPVEASVPTQPRSCLTAGPGPAVCISCTTLKEKS